MSGEPITTTRRQRFLFGFPYGLSNATLLAGLSATGRTETAPELPTPPTPPEIEKADAHLQTFHRLFPRNKPPGTGYCPCGRRISANKKKCLRCSQ